MAVPGGTDGRVTRRAPAPPPSPSFDFYDGALVALEHLRTVSLGLKTSRYKQRIEYATKADLWYHC
jgi:hypothetical protein